MYMVIIHRLDLQMPISFRVLFFDILELIIRKTYQYGLDHMDENHFRISIDWNRRRVFDKMDMLYDVHTIKYF